MMDEQAGKHSLVTLAVEIGFPEAAAWAVLGRFRAEYEDEGFLTPEMCGDTFIEAVQKEVENPAPPPPALGVPVSALATDVVVLTDDESEGPPPAKRTKGPAGTASGGSGESPDGGEDPDERHRRAIMAMAARVNEGGSAREDGSDVAPESPGGGGGGERAGTDEDEQRRKIMAMASAVNAGAPANSLLAQMAAERHARRGVPPPPQPAPAGPTDNDGGGEGTSGGGAAEVTLYQQNVWFREDAELQVRMEMIGNFITSRQPDIICFQEVTANIHTILSRQPWWGGYKVKSSRSPRLEYYVLLLSRLPLAKGPGGGRGAVEFYPFMNSLQGRELVSATLDAGGGARLTVATSHLESFVPGDDGSRQRAVQLKESLSLLSRAGDDVLFAGDMNWDDGKQGDMPLTPGWEDVWSALKPGDPGYTYDAATNGMLYKGNAPLQKRLDRILQRGGRYRASEVEMVLQEAAPGKKWKKPTRAGRLVHLPVLASDHYGLFVTLRRTGA